VATIGSRAQHPPWLVRISDDPDPDSVPLGAGLYLGAGQVMTCAHVILDDEELPDDRPEVTVYVTFEYAGPHEPIAASTTGWFGRDDIAVLSLAAPAPPSAAAAAFCSADDTWRHAVLMFGYPRGDITARPSNGRVAGPAGNYWLTLEADSGQGFEPERGFSGTAVYDLDEDAVIGMVGWREGPRLEGRPEIRVGYATSSDRLAQLWALPGGPMQLPGHRARIARAGKLVELLGPDNELPRIADVDIYDIGVKSSKYPPGRDPYVPRRDVDDALATALNVSGFVLADGPSAAGKSRSAIEMLLVQRPSARLMVPFREPGVLEELAQLNLAADYQADGVVLWLDNLETYLGPRGLDRKVLRRFLEAEHPVEVVAMMASGRRAKLAEKSDMAARLAGVLQRATEVRVTDASAREELETAQRLYPTESFSQRGIGAHLASAQDLERRFLDGRAIEPAGWAVVQAAVDWRRMGIDAPVSREWLRELFEVYVDEVAALDFENPDAVFSSGFKWARHALEGRSALLNADRTSERTGFRAFDSLVDQADRGSAGFARPVAERAWAMVTGDSPELDADSLLGVTLAAAAANLADIAFRAARLARDRAGTGSTGVWATLFLGWLSGTTGDPTSARGYLAEVAASPVPEAAGWAQIDLATMLVDDEEFDEAERLLRLAMANEDPQMQALATAELGAVLVTMDRADEALPLLESVVAAGEIRQATDLASSQLGQIIGGTAVSDQGYKSSDRLSLAFPAGQRRAGSLFEEIRKGRAGLAEPTARHSLGWLYMIRGEPERAQPLLEAALNSGDERIVLPTQAALGRLRLLSGDREGGEPLLRAAYSAGALDAGLTLAEIAYFDDDIPAAIELLTEIEDRGDSHYAPAAADLLGDICCAQGDIPAGRAAYRRAISWHKRVWSAIAAVDLAMSLASGDTAERAEARTLLESVADGANRQQAARAWDLLGDLLVAEGDHEAARAAYQRVVDSDQPYWAALARVDLARLLIDAFDDTPQAERLLTQAAGSDYSVVAAQAHLLLGIRAEEQAESAAAELHFAAAVGTDVPQLDVFAEFCLTVLTAQRGDLAAAASHADKMSTALEGWAGVPRPDRSAPRPRSAEGIYLAAVDHLYESASPDESVVMLEAMLSECADGVRPTAITAARARLGRARFHEHRYAEAESLLRSALAESSAAGPSQWSTEALSRWFLASLLAVENEDDEARQILEPLVESGDAEYLPRALHLLGRIARLRVVRLIDNNRREEASEELAESAELLRRAIQEAVDSGDLMTMEHATDDLAMLDEELKTAAGHRGRPPGPRSVQRPGTAATIEAPSAAAGASPAQPLPADLMVRLGEVAGAEGEAAEALYWFERAEAALRGAHPDGIPGLLDRIGRGRAVVTEEGLHRGTV